jgi:hypothetical protein
VTGSPEVSAVYGPDHARPGDKYSHDTVVG